MIKSAFIFPASYTKDRFTSDLASVSLFKEEDPTSVKLQIFDTFDWRLYNQSLSLFRFGTLVTLYHLGEDLILWSGSVPEIPKFARDFPEEALRRYLEPAAKIRALLTLVSGRIEVYSYRVLNKDQKTTARVRYESFRGDGTETGQTFGYIRLIPVRGYQSSYTRLAKFFMDRGFMEGSGEDLYYTFMRASGKKPGDYSSRLDIQLEKGMRSDDALRVILGYLLRVMRTNESGIKEDIDTEFLHDYRVSIRRTRSALSQLKGVFPPEVTARFRADFARLGELTNSLRDLDVYMLKEDQYKKTLPPELKSDISPLFNHLEGKRQNELNTVTSYLESEEYQTGILEYERFLDEKTTDSQGAPFSGKLVYELARESIFKRYKRVLKKGRAAKKSIDDDELHRLRIECKKLRYLIEFFASLFDPVDTSRILKQLRRLQDNLGDFNDVCIQVNYLLDISQELAAGDEPHARTLLAIGSLIGSLEKSKQVYKKGFVKIFNKFSAPKNYELYTEMFSSDEGHIAL